MVTFGKSWIRHWIYSRQRFSNALKLHFIHAYSQLIFQHWPSKVVQNDVRVCYFANHYCFVVIFPKTIGGIYSLGIICVCSDILS